jgi:hypothetical protein
MAPTLGGWQARAASRSPRPKPTRWAYGACRHVFPLPCYETAVLDLGTEVRYKGVRGLDPLPEGLPGDRRAEVWITKTSDFSMPERWPSG